jgi:hypothetical protein
MSGSRSIAAARSRRAGETTNIVSGGRPITSIASQSAFVPQQYPQQQPQPNRGGGGGRGSGGGGGGRGPQQQQLLHQQQLQQQQPSNGLPFTKLSISDAIGLITLRLGRVEQFIIDTEMEESSQSNNSQMSLPENSKIIDSSLLTTIINRLDSLEKKEQVSVSSERLIQVQTELTTTKEMVINLTSLFESFVKDTSNKFVDFEMGISEIEKVIYVGENVYKSNNELELANDESNNETANDGTLNDTNENAIVSVDLKTIIKEELSRTSE